VPRLATEGDGDIRGDEAHGASGEGTTTPALTDRGESAGGGARAARTAVGAADTTLNAVDPGDAK